MINDIKDQIAASISTKSELMDDGYLLEMVADMSEHCLRSLKAGGKLILAGNGGSLQMLSIFQLSLLLGLCLIVDH